MKNEEWNEDQMKILHEYCDNEMAEIKKMCNLIIMNAGGISGKEYDDIYSLAQFLLFKCVKKYDANNKKGASFKTFYRGILNRRLYATYLRDKNRQCRSNTRIDKDGNRVFGMIISITLTRTIFKIMKLSLKCLKCHMRHIKHGCLIQLLQTEKVLNIYFNTHLLILVSMVFAW